MNKTETDGQITPTQYEEQAEENEDTSPASEAEENDGTIPEEEVDELSVLEPGYNNPSAPTIRSNNVTPVQIGTWLSDISNNQNFIDWCKTSGINRNIPGSGRPVNEINIILKNLFNQYIESRNASQTTS